jgi:hypothetical protein
VLTRRASAIAIIFLVVVIGYFAFKAYESSQNTQALKNYDSEVATMVEGEETQVAQPVFSSLDGAPGTTGQQLVALQGALQQDAVTARQDATTAAAWSVPSTLAGAQQAFLLVLNMRAEALTKIQNYITPALASGSIPAIKDIAGAMDMIFSSDIVYDVQVVPLIQQALVGDGIQVNFGGTSLPPTTPFLPNQSWTIAGYVEGRILGQTTPQLGGTLGAGTHGHKLIGVEVGSTVLSGTSAVQQVTFANPLDVTVSFENDGENAEIGVLTQVSVSSASTTTITQTEETRETLPGQSYTAVVPLEDVPVGTPLELKATIEPVQGEHDLGNNTLTFFVEFSKS